MSKKCIYLLLTAFTLFLGVSCKSQQGLQDADGPGRLVQVATVGDRLDEKGRYVVSMVNFSSIFYVSPESKDCKKILSVLKHSRDNRESVQIVVSKDKSEGGRIIKAMKIKEAGD